MIDYLFENRPRYLLVDEIDKMGPKDHALLLNLKETVALHPNTIQLKIEGKALLVRKKSKLMGVNNMKILIAEDDRDIALMYRVGLKEPTYLPVIEQMIASFRINTQST